MSNNIDKSEVKKAAENVNPNELENNLQSESSDAKASNKAENLSEKEKTPFIEEDLRTDK